MVEIVYLPQDLDGLRPGMFPEKLPQGASFDDNFNGSRTFRWQPLQADVGMTRYAVTVIDQDYSINPEPDRNQFAATDSLVAFRGSACQLRRSRSARAG